MSQHYITIPPHVFRDLVRALNARSVRRAPRVISALDVLQRAVDATGPDADTAEEAA